MRGVYTIAGNEINADNVADKRRLERILEILLCCLPFLDDRDVEGKVVVEMRHNVWYLCNVFFGFFVDL